MSLLPRFYLASAALVRRVVAGVDLLFTGLWLGLLSRRSLHAIDELIYRRRSSYSSEAHNRRGLFDWEEAAVRQYFTGCRTLLLIGAGGGREVIALAAMGFAVRGYECNPALVEVARTLLASAGAEGRASVEPLERDAAPTAEAGADGVIVGWSAYMLIIGRERRVELLRQLRALLPEGGPLLISFFSRPEHSPRLRTIATIATGIRRLLRRPPAELGDDLAPNFVHRFTVEEVRRELLDGGFDPLEIQEERPGPSASGFAVARAGRG